MRLVAQTKLGFYPAAPEAVGRIARHLRLSDTKPESVQVLDPCAGEGLAIKQIADALGIPAARTYAVELDAGRAAKVRENLGPDAKVLGPASFMGTRITGYSFGLVYCNPPFDDELGGGGRVEQTFAEKSTRLLKEGGTLALVMPITAIQGNWRFIAFLDSQYEDAALFRFPDEVRKFREVVFLGKKRRQEKASTYDGYLNNLLRYSYRGEPDLEIVGETGQTWKVPHAWAPHTFAKVEMTEAELIEAVESSPLLARLRPPKPPKPKRPPLPLYKGHVALLLASGMLDGVIEPEGEPPHVVRGTARKVDYLADKTEATNPDTGAVTHKEVWSQKIVLTVRAVDATGEIKTFEDGAADDAAKVAASKQ
jgi:16S rRNA G966 N2-methylase RsmD